MRKTALVPQPATAIVRLMLYTSPEGVYLFEYNTLEDASAVGDYWFATMTEAEAACLVEYGIAPRYWQEIPDSLEHCQHDWLAPVRIKGRDTGQPQWGHLERLENGRWVSFISNSQAQ